MPEKCGSLQYASGYRALLWLLLLLVFLALPGLPAPVTLVENGAAKCCVVVGTEASFKEPPLFNWTPRLTLLAWAADDVATYLGKMSGATVPVGDKPVEGLLPIYVGCPPEEVKLAKATEYGDAYVIDVSEKRIILHGESRHAVYYVTADLLNRLGVRWYAPGEIGEVVLQRKTITMETGRTESVPDFITRRLWCAGPEPTRWMYRNRLGEVDISAAVKREGNNELLVAVDNTFPNDIGVGGIIRPAVIYMPKQ